MKKSKLIIALDMQDRRELAALTRGWKEELRLVAPIVIFNCVSYREAGEIYGMSKNSVYELLKRIYFKKYGVKYASNNPKNT